MAGIGTESDRIYYGTDTRMDGIALGIVTALSYSYLQRGTTSAGRVGKDLCSLGDSSNSSGNPPRLLNRSRRFLPGHVPLLTPVGSNLLAHTWRSHPPCSAAEGLWQDRQLAPRSVDGPGELQHLSCAPDGLQAYPRPSERSSGGDRNCNTHPSRSWDRSSLLDFH